MAARLALGTVQFGLDYGVSNRAGQVGETAAAAILNAAQQAGVTLLDTAPGYGDSEAVLGRLDAGRRFAIISKTPQFRDAIGPQEAEQVRRSLEQSLQRLGVARLYGLMVHWPGDLLGEGGERLWRVLSDARAEGLVGRIGLSLYDPEEFRAAVARFAIDLVQVPVNLLDQRFLEAGIFAEAAARGIEVHARSAFLQGLLLMDEAAAVARLPVAAAALARFHAAVPQRDRLRACLDFVRAIPGIDQVVCGVTDATEFAQISKAFAQQQRAFATDGLACSDSAVIDPRRW